MDYIKLSKEAIGHLYKSHASLRHSALDVKLIALAELRTSQLNGCAYCCSFHSSELREMGISQNLIDKIPGYRHSLAFDERQMLVLRWTDAVTFLAKDTDEIKHELEKQFTEKELTDLTASISLMNALNRLRITLGEKD